MSLKLQGLVLITVITYLLKLPQALDISRNIKTTYFTDNYNLCYSHFINSRLLRTFAEDRENEE